MRLDFREPGTPASACVIEKHFRYAASDLFSLRKFWGIDLH
jgi:hypothetical protein